MAISEKQLKANQKNAKLGGVKTEKGKEIIKYNAIKHGLLSEKIVIKGEDSEEFCLLRKNIIKEINPIGPIEYFLAERVVANMWRLNRVLSIEKSLIEYNNNDLMVAFGGKMQKERERNIKILEKESLDRLIRYKKSIEHSLFNDLKYLEYKK